MKIAPAPHRLVRDPVSGREITGEVEIPDNDPFWQRRLACGDVVKVPAPAPSKKEK